MSEDTVVVYKIQDVQGGISTLKSEISKIWQELQDEGSETHKYAVDHGIDLSELPQDYPDVLMLRKESAGFEASVVDLIVTFATGSVAKDLWKHVILPQLRHRFGDKALQQASKKKKSDDQ